MAVNTINSYPKRVSYISYSNLFIVFFTINNKNNKFPFNVKNKMNMEAEIINFSYY
ncbi:hypothetical protein GM3708_3220 [Geminocystis sp. NIES-3708]|nr:hypothetical protein GM3708_3220 [Geminocystis sp. NIES-3708]